MVGSIHGRRTLPALAVAVKGEPAHQFWHCVAGESWSDLPDGELLELRHELAAAVDLDGAQRERQRVDEFEAP